MVVVNSIQRTPLGQIYSLYQNISYKITQRKPHWNEHKMHTGLKQTKFREDKKTAVKILATVYFK